MENVFVDEQSLHNIADAIREKNGSNQSYYPSEMAQAIMDISTSGGVTVRYGTFNVGTGKITPYRHFNLGVGTIDDVGFTIRHNLGKVPKTAMLIADLNGVLNVGDTTICAVAQKIGTGWIQKGVECSDSYGLDHIQMFNSTLNATTSKNNLTSNSWGTFCGLTDTDMFVLPGGQDANSAFQDNLTYTWIVIG